MDHADFHIGCEFTTDTGRWRCTDIGTRVIVAIKVDPVEVVRLEDGQKTTRQMSQAEAEREGWFNGPPHGLAEWVFDEDDMEECEPIRRA
jgi:hypothetical protein